MQKQTSHFLNFFIKNFLLHYHFFGEQLDNVMNYVVHSIYVFICEIKFLSIFRILLTSHQPLSNLILKFPIRANHKIKDKVLHTKECKNFSLQKPKSFLFVIAIVLGHITHEKNLVLYNAMIFSKKYQNTLNLANQCKPLFVSCHIVAILEAIKNILRQVQQKLNSYNCVIKLKT
jgi:hypothetical protein